jgi:hypothetical protein
LAEHGNYDVETDSHNASMVERSAGCEAGHGPMSSRVDRQNQSGKNAQKIAPSQMHNDATQEAGWPLGKPFPAGFPGLLFLDRHGSIPVFYRDALGKSWTSF